MRNKNLIILTTNGSADGLDNILTPDRNYDIAVIDYESILGNSPAHKCDVEYVYEPEGGFKFINIKKFLDANKKIMDAYDRFWLIDWDLEIEKSSINKLFMMSYEFGFDLCQPALSEDSHISWIITKRVYDSKARITDFVEIMCPMFSKSSLKSVIWTFDLCYSGWGLDFLWRKILDNKTIGIIDDVVITHPKPISSHTWILPNSKTASQEFDDIISEQNISTYTNTLKFL